MRYLVKARLKPGREQALFEALQNGTLGRGSIAGDEYHRNMHQARLAADGVTRWVEVCYCDVPLAEERPYWEEYFDLLEVKDAHARSNCRDENRTEPWACSGCDCTRKLEAQLQREGRPFFSSLRSRALAADAPNAPVTHPAKDAP
jgi:hypothetical protein